MGRHARRFENGNSNIINTAGGIMLIIIHSGWSGSIAWFVCKEITKQKCPGVSQHSHISHVANAASTILGHWCTLRNKGRKLPQLRKLSNLFADCHKNAVALAIFHLDLYRLSIRYEKLIYFYDRNYLHAKDRLVSWTSMEFPGKHRVWMKKSGDHFVTCPKGLCYLDI